MSGEFEQAYRALADGEPVFARLAEEYGHPDPFEWHDGGRTGSSRFAAMLLHIVSQRVSAVAAFVVFDRIATAAGGVPAPESVIAAGADRLRECGLSWTKVTCILDLAQRQTSGVIDVETMGALDDDEVIAALTAVRGIGLWSAQAFLIRQLRRPDVLPADDMGIRRAVRASWRLEALPTVNGVRTRAAAWAPYRTYAATLLWRSLAPVGELSDPKARALSREAARGNAPKDAQA